MDLNCICTRSVEVDNTYGNGYVDTGYVYVIGGISQRCKSIFVEIMVIQMEIDIPYKLYYNHPYQIRPAFV